MMGSEQLPPSLFFEFCSQSSEIPQTNGFNLLLSADRRFLLSLPAYESSEMLLTDNPKRVNRTNFLELPREQLANLLFSVSSSPVGVWSIRGGMNAYWWYWFSWWPEIGIC